MRDAFLAESEEWLKPPSPEEDALADEIEAMQTYKVLRAPAEQLAWSRMKPKECHTNAHWYADNDPSKSHWVQSGWWKQPNDVYMFHSVVLNKAGKLICITPAEGLEDQPLEFSPDDEIVWTKDANGVRKATRRGLEVPVFVRRKPLQAIAAYTLIRERLLSGMDPMEAGKINWHEIEGG